MSFWPKRPALVTTTLSNFRGGRLRELWIYFPLTVNAINFLRDLHLGHPRSKNLWSFSLFSINYFPWLYCACWLLSGSFVLIVLRLLWVSQVFTPRTRLATSRPYEFLASEASFLGREAAKRAKTDREWEVPRHINRTKDFFENLTEYEPFIFTWLYLSIWLLYDTETHGGEVIAKYLCKRSQAFVY